MSHPPKTDEAKPLHTVGRVLDSRWMMGLAVAAVLVAIVWALIDDGPRHRETATARSPATVELLGVPEAAEVLLDGQRIDNTRFAVTPGTRHLLEVTDASGQSWRQVFLAEGTLSLVVELRTHYREVDATPQQ
jgi:hypothetical protein